MSSPVVSSWNPSSSEHETEAPRHRAGPWIAEIIDAARRQTRARIDLRVQTRIAQGGVVEHVLSHRGPEQEADGELAPVDLVVQADGEVRIGISDHFVIADSWRRQRPVGAHLRPIR